MNRKKGCLLERSNYVKKCVADKAPEVSTISIIRKLAKELFLSESLIWKDYFLRPDVEPVKRKQKNRTGGRL